MYGYPCFAKSVQITTEIGGFKYYGIRPNRLESYWYLRKVFEEMLVYLRDRNPADDLLPWNIDPGKLKHLAEHV